MMMIVAANALVILIALPLVTLLLREAVASRRVLACVAAAVLVGAAAAASAVETAGTLPIVDGVLLVAVHISALVLLATYPDGRFTPRWIVAPLALGVGVQIGNALSGFSWSNESWWPLQLVVVWAALLIGAQLYRFLRRSTVDERRRTSWPVLALVVQMVVFTIGSAIQAGLTGGIGDAPASTAAAIVLNSFIGWGFAIGLIAPRIVNVDRALVRVIAVSIVGLGTLGAFAGLSALLALIGAAQNVVLWVSVILVAVVMLPFARFGGWLANLAVYRGRPDPLRTLIALGDQLDGAVDPLAVPLTVVEAVRSVLGLRGVALVGAGPLGAVSGDLGELVERFPVLYQGEQIAELAAAPREGESELAEHDRAVITHLIRQSAGALHGARTISELVEARARIVLAREEERRRLRRDLHDDLAPTFAGLGLGAAAVHEFSRSGDSRTSNAARELVTGLQAATRQLREIAYDLRPPVLDDQGLVAAIRDRVEITGASPEVSVIAPGERLTLPAAVESAALRIAQEAVMNVRRHAAAARCTITIDRTEEGLELEVTDDGRGIPHERRDGLGLRSIRERAAELGGWMTVERCREGGTRLFVSLPVAS